MRVVHRDADIEPTTLSMDLQEGASPTGTGP